MNERQFQEQEVVMSEKSQSESMQGITEAFGDSYRKVVQGAVDAQQRNVGLAQGWAENLSGLMESQAETNQALTRAMESYVKVVEEAVESQERTSRALAESLESYKEVIDRTVALQEKNVETSRNFFEGVIGELKAQTDGNLRRAEEMMEGSERQLDAFQQMFQETMGSYVEMMNAPYEMYRKNMEAFGGKSK